MRTVAIDGPAGAGKSTLAANLAQHLGLDRLDTGAMYRAVAWAALDRGIDVADQDAVASMARSLEIDQNDGVRVDGRDVTTAIRSEPVDSAVSIVAAICCSDGDGPPATGLGRTARRGRCRGPGYRNGGTPRRELKVYLTAAPDERARRRAAERGGSHTVSQVEAAVKRRDRLNSTRSTSPLPARQAEDAIVVDSTNRSAMSILEEVLGCLRTR